MGGLQNSQDRRARKAYRTYRTAAYSNEKLTEFAEPVGCGYWASECFGCTEDRTIHNNIDLKHSDTMLQYIVVVVIIEFVFRLGLCFAIQKISPMIGISGSWMNCILQSCSRRRPRNLSPVSAFRNTHSTVARMAS